jgi:hypothetical protein
MGVPGFRNGFPGVETGVPGFRNGFPSVETGIPNFRNGFPFAGKVAPESGSEPFFTGSPIFFSAFALKRFDTRATPIQGQRTSPVNTWPACSACFREGLMVA